MGGEEEFPSVTQAVGLTLAAELSEFATSVVASSNCASISRCCTFRTLGQASEAATELWTDFGGVEAYADYLQCDALVYHADKTLCGGAAWKRLLSELEVAVLLVPQARRGPVSNEASCRPLELAP